MTHYPGFIRRLLSTSQYGSFEPYEDPAELASNGSIRFLRRNQALKRRFV